MPNEGLKLTTKSPMLYQLSQPGVPRLIFVIGSFYQFEVVNKGQNAKANIKSLYGRGLKNRWHQFAVVAGVRTWEGCEKMAKKYKVR